MATLYQLKEEYAQLLALAEEPETDAATLMDTLEGLHGEIEDKAEGYVCVIKELEAEIDKFKAESDRLASYCLTLSNRVRAMKLSLLDTMDTMGANKIQTEHFRVSIAKNGGKQPMYVDPNIEAIPEEFIIRRPEPDKEKIREALDAGQELEFAKLLERGTHLSIR